MDDTIAYFNLIISGQRTINDVPGRVRNEVTALLKQAGYEHLITSDKKGI